jgi:hypothetical protein
MRRDKSKSGESRQFPSKSSRQYIHRSYHSEASALFCRNTVNNDDDDSIGL